MTSGFRCTTSSCSSRHPSLKATIFGSFNWSEPSYRFNREIGVATEDPLLFKAFADRWDQLAVAAE